MSEQINTTDTLDGKQIAEVMRDLLRKGPAYGERLTGAKILERAPGQPIKTWVIEGYDHAQKGFHAKRGDETALFDLAAIEASEILPKDGNQRLRLTGQTVAGPTTMIEGKQAVAWISARAAEASSDEEKAARASDYASRFDGAGFHFVEDKAKTESWTITFDPATRFFVAKRPGAEDRRVSRQTMSDGTILLNASQRALALAVTEAAQKKNASRVVDDRAIDFQTWKEMGEMNAAGIVADASFDFDLYAHDKDRIPRAPRPPAVFVSGGRGDLGNPHRTGRMSEEEAAHSLHDHYVRVLSARDEKSAALLSAMLRSASQAMRNEMREVRSTHADKANAASTQSNSRDIRRELMDMGRPADEAADMAERQAALNEGTTENNRIYVVAPTRLEAQVARGLLSLALDVQPMRAPRLVFKDADGKLEAATRWGVFRVEEAPEGRTLTFKGNDTDAFTKVTTVADTGEKGDRALVSAARSHLDERVRFGGSIVRVSDLPSRREVMEKLAKVRPPLYEDENAKRIGVFANWGAQKGIVGFLNANPDRIRGASVVAYADAELVGALKKDVRGVKIDPVRTGKPMRMVKEMFDGSEKVIVALADGTAFDDFTARILAEGARRGKLGAIVDKDGNVLPRAEIEAEAIRRVPSWLDELRNRNAGVYDLDPSSREGRLALALMHRTPDGDPQAGAKLTAEDQEKLIKTGMKLSEIVALASTDEGARALAKDTGISKPSVRLLGDNASMNDSRESFAAVQRSMKTQGTTAVFKSEFPKVLRDNPSAPDLLFLRGDAEAFKAIGATIGFVGEKNTQLLPQMASKVAELASGVRQAGVTVAFAEGHALPKPTAETLSSGAPVLMVLPGPHRAADEAAVLNWTAEQVWSQLSATTRDGKRTYTIDLDAGAKAAVLKGEGVDGVKAEWDPAKEGMLRREREESADLLKAAVEREEARRFFGADADKHRIAVEWSATRTERLQTASAHGRTWVIGRTPERDRVELDRREPDGRMTTLKSIDIKGMDEKQFQSRSQAMLADLKQMANQDARDLSPSAEAKRLRDAVVANGGFVVSAHPDVRLKNSKVEKGFMDVTPPTRMGSDPGANTLVAQAAAITVVTQVGAQSDIAAAVGTAFAESVRRKGAYAVTVMTPPGIVQTLNDVAGNLALMSRDPSEVIRTIGLKGLQQAGVRDLPSGKRVATPIASGSADAAAATLVKAVTNRTPASRDQRIEEEVHVG